MRSYAQDRQFGIQSEQLLLPTFNALFDTSFQTTSRYDPFDFISPTFNLELKTRTNKLAQYPTTLLPYSKIEHADASPIPTIFAFKFTDKLAYIQYDRDLFATFETSDFARNPRVDYHDAPKSYIYIPIKHLRIINPNAEHLDRVA